MPNCINRELRDSFADRLVNAAEGACTLDEILDWLTALSVEDHDHGFQHAADWLIRAYGSDESTPGERITQAFFESRESRLLLDFLYSDRNDFPIKL